MGSLRLTIYFVFPLLVLALTNSGNTDKRLLLNDADVILARLNSLENEVALLKSKNGMLENEDALLKSKNVMLENEVALLKSKDVMLETQDSHLQQVVQSLKNAGSIYIRWGRTDCGGSNTELVYTGFAAGQSYTSLISYGDRYGGPSNTLCLPNNPELNNITGPDDSLLYGTEFERDLFGPGAIDEDVPCALCRSTNTYTSVMIPGRKSCYSGWKLEYYGILASNSYVYKASSYICVDNRPEYLQAGKDNKNGNLLYPTTTKCGSLPCPPYTENALVNCVVCSK